MPKILPQKRAASLIHGIVAPQSNRLEHDDQQRETHGELGEKIVEGRGKGEMQAVN